MVENVGQWQNIGLIYTGPKYDHQKNACVCTYTSQSTYMCMRAYTNLEAPRQFC